MNMQKSVRIILIIIAATGILFGEYLIFVKGPEYAKPQSGTVLQSYEPRGRSHDWIALVRFDNGDTQTVNTGRQEYKINERFTSQLSWSPILGNMGLAYGWNPGDGYIWAVMPAAVFNIFLILGLMVYIVWFAFFKKKES